MLITLKNGCQRPQAIFYRRPRSFSTLPIIPYPSQNPEPVGVGIIGWFQQGRVSGDHFSDEESKRRLFNRLLYRSRQRGFLELDLVLGRWVEEHIHSMDVDGVKALIGVLDLENPDLWKWLTEQEQPPEPVKMNPVFSAVQEKVMKNLSNSAPETRSVPRKPWVLGWD